jgi:uncharacterized protein (TIGR02118 family)
LIYKSIYLAKRNPSIAPEDWPKAWRSHPRTVAQMGSVGAAIGAAIDTINYCARVREPVLDGARIDPPGVSREHDGVAVVSSGSEDLLRIGLDRTGQEAVIADEVRVFGRPADEFSLACREVVSLGGPPGKAAVIRFLARKPGAASDQFVARWTGRHADLARVAVGPGKIVRYVQNLVVREPPAGYEFDGVSEAWFASVEDAVRSFADPALAPLSGDLADFCDLERSVTMLTEVIYRVPRE